MSIPADESICSLTLADFRAATASTQPTPGGGSVACVSGALGLGLLIMAFEISRKRKDAVWPTEAQEILEKGHRGLYEISADADADIHAFQSYMAALKLPKGTEDEKRSRAQALQGATRRATEAALLSGAALGGRAAAGGTLVLYEIQGGDFVLQFERSILVDPAKVFTERSLEQPASLDQRRHHLRHRRPRHPTTELIQAFLPINSARKLFGRLRCTP